jgi:hypothetical protein
VLSIIDTSVTPPVSTDALTAIQTFAKSASVGITVCFPFIEYAVHD